MNLNVYILGDWLFYGGLFGAVTAGILFYVTAKKIGPKNVTWKHSIVILALCIIPTILLPLWLIPGHLAVKVFGTILLISFLITRYIATTNAQEANSAAKRSEDYSPPPIRKKIFWVSVATAVIAFLLLERFGG